jgi:hypothetical protein
LASASTEDRRNPAAFAHVRTGAAGTGKPVTPKLRKLPAGQSVQVTISPLDNGPGENPLAEGTWQATVCLGEVCSNSVALAVTKR